MVKTGLFKAIDSLIPLDEHLATFRVCSWSLKEVLVTDSDCGVTGLAILFALCLGSRHLFVLEEDCLYVGAFDFGERQYAGDMRTVILFSVTAWTNCCLLCVVQLLWLECSLCSTACNEYVVEKAIATENSPWSIASVWHALLNQLHYIGLCIWLSVEMCLTGVDMMNE
ncbi:hypothetical protein Tco_0437974 [Tanacetum coccineum]